MEILKFEVLHEKNSESHNSNPVFSEHQWWWLGAEVQQQFSLPLHIFSRCLKTLNAFKQLHTGLSSGNWGKMCSPESAEVPFRQPLCMHGVGVRLAATPPATTCVHGMNCCFRTTEASSECSLLKQNVKVFICI